MNNVQTYVAKRKIKEGELVSFADVRLSYWIVFTNWVNNLGGNKWY